MVKNLPIIQETGVWSLGLEDPPGDGNGNPLQYSCLGNLMDRGAWWVTARGVAKNRTQLSDSALLLLLDVDPALLRELAAWDWAQLGGSLRGARPPFFCPRLVGRGLPWGQGCPRESTGSGFQKLRLWVHQEQQLFQGVFNSCMKCGIPDGS